MFSKERTDPDKAEWREIQVAVKQLLDMQHVEASQLEEFAREVALLQSLKHHPVSLAGVQ